MRLQFDPLFGVLLTSTGCQPPTGVDIGALGVTSALLSLNCLDDVGPTVRLRLRRSPVARRAHRLRTSTLCRIQGLNAMLAPAKATRARTGRPVTFLGRNPDFRWSMSAARAS